jgi:hypothetical protein
MAYLLTFIFSLEKQSRDCIAYGSQEKIIRSYSIVSLFKPIVT